MVDARLLDVMSVLVRDLKAGGCPVPAVREEPAAIEGPYVRAMLYSAGGEGHSIAMATAADSAQRMVEVAGQIQDWTVEELWSQRRPAVWPECPEHPGSHPLTAVVADGTAVWSCPVSSAVVSAIGGLSG